MRRAAKVDAMEIKQALESAGCLDGASAILGISKATLNRHMAKHGIRSNPLDADVGRRFSRWTVLSVVAGTKRSKRKAVCQCDCGTVRELLLPSVTSGATKSCGCLAAKVTTARSTKHGKHSSPEYNSWMGMKQRCNDPAAQNYPWYGALGVRVCERWINSFADFLADMGAKPSSEHSIDRIDPFGNYEPGNCRWATRAEQSANKRKQHAAAGAS